MPTLSLLLSGNARAWLPSLGKLLQGREEACGVSLGQNWFSLSLLVDCNLATGTGVQDLVSHCCSGRGARVRNALEVSQHVASSRVRAGADAVFRCQFILSLVRGGGGLEGRRILQRSLVPGRSYVDRGS